MGESYGRWTLGHDEEVMPNITSANIACGFHGGDPARDAPDGGAGASSTAWRSARTRACPTCMGFGRRRMDVSPAELKDYPPLPGRRARRLRPGRGHHAPARQAARHPVPHVRGEPAARPGRRRAGRRARSRADPDDHGHDEVRRGGPQDEGCASPPRASRIASTRTTASSSRASSARTRWSPIRPRPPSRPSAWSWRARSRRSPARRST